MLAELNVLASGLELCSPITACFLGWYRVEMDDQQSTLTRSTIITYKNQRSTLSRPTINTFKIRITTPTRTLTLRLESSNAASPSTYLTTLPNYKASWSTALTMFISTQPRVVCRLATVWGRTARASLRERSASSRSYSVAPRRPTAQALPAVTLEKRMRLSSTSSKTSEWPGLTPEIVFNGSEFASLKDSVIIVTGKSHLS